MDPSRGPSGGPIDKYGGTCYKDIQNALNQLGEEAQQLGQNPRQFNSVWGLLAQHLYGTSTLRDRNFLCSFCDKFPSTNQKEIYLETTPHSVFSRLATTYSKEPIKKNSRPHSSVWGLLAEELYGCNDFEARRFLNSLWDITPKPEINTDTICEPPDNLLRHQRQKKKPKPVYDEYKERQATIDLLHCSFSNSSGQCHQMNYTNKIGLKVIAEEDKYVLSLRTGVNTSSMNYMCLHHEQALLLRFAFLKGKKCCDPFGKHKKQMTTALRTITINTYSKIKGVVPKAVPGKQICFRCYRDAKLLNWSPVKSENMAIEPQDRSERSQEKDVYDPVHKPDSTVVDTATEMRITTPATKRFKMDYVFLCTCESCLAKEVSLRDPLLREHFSQFFTPVECRFCDEIFDCRRIYTDHEELHKKNEMLEQDPSDRKSSLRVKKTKSYICEVCASEFYSEADLNVHKELHSEPLHQRKRCVRRNPGKSYECGLCDYRIYSYGRPSRRFRKHLKIHKGNPFTCNFCPVMFPSGKDLRSHVPIFHSAIRKNVFSQCRVCKKHFSSRVDLINHLKVHATANSFKSTELNVKSEVAQLEERTLLTCNICYSKFVHEIDFNVHLEQAHKVTQANGHASHELNTESKMQSVGSTLLTCNVCSSKFEQEIEFNVHTCMSVASNLPSKSDDLRLYERGRAPKSCDLCGLTFSKLALLNKHFAKSHAVTKMFPCHICGKRFTRSIDCANHKADHKDDRLFDCALCKRKCSNRRSIEEHYRYHISQDYDVRKFCCYLCGARFRLSKFLLNHHVAKHALHDLPGQCLIPPRDLPSPCFTVPVTMNVSFLHNLMDLYIS